MTPRIGRHVRDLLDSRPVEVLWAELDELERAHLCSRIDAYLYELDLKYPSKHPRSPVAVVEKIFTDVLIALQDLEAV